MGRFFLFSYLHEGCPEPCSGLLHAPGKGVWKEVMSEEEEKVPICMFTMSWRPLNHVPRSVARRKHKAALGTTAAVFALDHLLLYWVLKQNNCVRYMLTLEHFKGALQRYAQLSQSVQINNCFCLFARRGLCAVHPSPFIMLC